MPSDTRADLHTHTTFSDGTLSPADLVEEALWNGLSAIAITDHDTVDGLAEALAAGRDHMVDVIPGVELSCHHEGAEVHLLGLLIDSTPALVERLRKLRGQRVERMKAMLAKLDAIGIHISLDEVRVEASDHTLGRPHLARLLLRKGFVSTIGEAFQRFLGNTGSAYIPKEKLDVAEGVALIREAGGVSILAHPGSHSAFEILPPETFSLLDGLEVYHPDHGLEKEHFLAAEAKRMGLLATGGSDYHGKGMHGQKIGQPSVSCKVVDDLRELAAKRKKA